MEKKKGIPITSIGKYLFSLVLLFLTAITGVGSEVMMAAASDLPDAGNTNSGEGGIATPPDGIATETQGRIHTSAAGVVVLPEAEEFDVELNMSDVRIDTFCASGPANRTCRTASRPASALCFSS